MGCERDRPKACRSIVAMETNSAQLGQALMALRLKKQMEEQRWRLVGLGELSWMMGVQGAIECGPCGVCPASNFSQSGKWGL